MTGEKVFTYPNIPASPPPNSTHFFKLPYVGNKGVLAGFIIAMVTCNVKTIKNCSPVFGYLLPASFPRPFPSL